MSHNNLYGRMHDEQNECFSFSFMEIFLHQTPFDSALKCVLKLEGGLYLMVQCSTIRRIMKGHQRMGGNVCQAAVASIRDPNIHIHSGIQWASPSCRKM